MAEMDNATKFKLERLLGMAGGYVLEFSNEDFADFVRTCIGVDPYEKYGGKLSKAKLLRRLWEDERDADVAQLNLDLIERWRLAKQLAREDVEPAEEKLSGELTEHFRNIKGGNPESESVTTPAPFTTQASVTANQIQIEIHQDIYDHIWQYLEAENYFHAVEEAYKLVREKLREITGEEAASEVFTNSAQSNKHYASLFGKAEPATEAEADFFRGIGYVHLAIQHLRNDKVHSVASSIDPNLAIHYISLASLAYDMITRYVSEETVQLVEELVRSKRSSYKSATAFYADFEQGKWLESFDAPPELASSSVRKVLKEKWIDEADFTRNFDHSNLVLMRMELVASELTANEIDYLLSLPTKNDHGYDQSAGLPEFIELISNKYPGIMTPKASAWIADFRERWR